LSPHTANDEKDGMNPDVVGAQAVLEPTVAVNAVLVKRTGEKPKLAIFFDWLNVNKRLPLATSASCTEVGAPKLVGSW
jgi:hypothetical protein